ncbi:MAG: hypothetical protein EOM03_16090 [Clostridia bacterium]|nr:hypothetical protein [Clostridia bacterium]
MDELEETVNAVRQERRDELKEVNAVRQELRDHIRAHKGQAKAFKSPGLFLASSTGPQIEALQPRRAHERAGAWNASGNSRQASTGQIWSTPPGYALPIPANAFTLGGHATTGAFFT